MVVLARTTTEGIGHPDRRSPMALIIAALFGCAFGVATGVLVATLRRADEIIEAEKALRVARIEIERASALLVSLRAETDDFNAEAIANFSLRTAALLDLLCGANRGAA